MSQDDEEASKPKRRSRSRSRSKAKAEEAKTDDAVASTEVEDAQIEGMETVDLTADEAEDTTAEVPEGSSPMETVKETPVETPASDEAADEDDSTEAAEAPSDDDTKPAKATSSPTINAGRRASNAAAT